MSVLSRVANPKFIHQHPLLITMDRNHKLLHRNRIVKVAFTIEILADARQKALGNFTFCEFPSGEKEWFTTCITNKGGYSLGHRVYAHNVSRLC